MNVRFLEFIAGFSSPRSEYLAAAGQIADHIGLEPANDERVDLHFHLLPCPEADIRPAQISRTEDIGNGRTVSLTDTAYVVEDPFSTFILDRRKGEATGYIRATNDLPTGTPVAGLLSQCMITFVLFLRTRGWYPLHAAALVRGNTCLLLAAPSDSGKSTLAYSLVRNGWCFLSDDAVFIQETTDGIVIRPFRRHFGLDTDASDIFEELTGTSTFQIADDGKWRVEMERHYPGRYVTSGYPTLVVCPTLTGEPASRFTALNPSEALFHLLGQSVLFDLEAEIARRNMAVLQCLVRQTNHYRLESGLDLLNDPALSVELIEKMIAAR